jgi:hypothetical protein
VPSGFLNHLYRGCILPDAALFLFLPMEEKKKGCIIYADLIHTVKKLPKDNQAELFMAILEYINGETPVIESLLVDVVFEPIKRQIVRDIEKYHNVSQKNRENGRKGGRPAKANESEQNPKNPPLFLKSEKSHIDTDTEKDTDTDNGTDKEIVKYIEKKGKSPSAPIRSKKTFIIPSVEDVQAFANENMIGSKDLPERFVNYYEANGWMINRNHMKNWKATFKNWVLNEKKYETNQRTNSNAETPQQRKERIYRESGSTIGRGGEFLDIFAIPHDSK